MARAYAMLMRALLDGRLGHEEFSQMFVSFFKNDRTAWDEATYLALDSVFAAADLYWEEDQTRQPPYIDDAELIRAVSKAIDLLGS